MDTIEIGTVVTWTWTDGLDTFSHIGIVVKADRDNAANWLVARGIVNMPDSARQMPFDVDVMSVAATDLIMVAPSTLAILRR
jgi:hypothetical protein